MLFLPKNLHGKLTQKTTDSYVARFLSLEFQLLQNLAIYVAIQVVATLQYHCSKFVALSLWYILCKAQTT